MYRRLCARLIVGLRFGWAWAKVDTLEPEPIRMAGMERRGGKKLSKMQFSARRPSLHFLALLS